MATEDGVDVVVSQGPGQTLVSGDIVNGLDQGNNTADKDISFFTDDSDDKALIEDAKMPSFFRTRAQHSLFSQSSPRQFSAFFLIRAPPFTAPF